MSQNEYCVEIEQSERGVRGVNENSIRQIQVQQIQVGTSHKYKTNSSSTDSTSTSFEVQILW